MKGWLTAGGLAQGETETDMLLLGVYILVTLVAMTWIASDSGTTGVPELFFARSSRHHAQNGRVLELDVHTRMEVCDSFVADRVERSPGISTVRTESVRVGTIRTMCGVDRNVDWVARDDSLDIPCGLPSRATATPFQNSSTDTSCCTCDVRFRLRTRSSAGRLRHR